VDTIELAEVPEDERVDRDGDPADPDVGSAAAEGGVDDDLADVYDDPGGVVEEPLG
jgi:hypothetical protein